MNKKVFISGSISIKKLPDQVLNSIDKIIFNNLEILIGDAGGVDRAVQEYCAQKKYFNVTVYSIYDVPRNRASTKFNFKKIQVSDNIKSGFRKQQQKDIAMTRDCDYCLIVWDEKSKGSYQNILRGIEFDKKVKIFLAKQAKYLEQKKINKITIENIFRENNGYSASEIVDILNDNIYSNFAKGKDLYEYLLKKSVIKKENNIYVPVESFSYLFILDNYKGRPKGIRFTTKFIDWFRNELNGISTSKKAQLSLFEK